MPRLRAGFLGPGGLFALDRAGFFRLSSCLLLLLLLCFSRWFVSLLQVSFLGLATWLGFLGVETGWRGWRGAGNWGDGWCGLVGREHKSPLVRAATTRTTNKHQRHVTGPPGQGLEAAAVRVSKQWLIGSFIALAFFSFFLTSSCFAALLVCLY